MVRRSVVDRRLLSVPAGRGGGCGRGELEAHMYRTTNLTQESPTEQAHASAIHRSLTAEIQPADTLLPLTGIASTLADDHHPSLDSAASPLCVDHL
jgi:hypothetical protein